MVIEMHVDIAGATWRFEALRSPQGAISSLWVSCVHWPGCEDSREDFGDHGEFGLGVCREGAQFRVANEWFWKAHDIDYRPVLDAVARVMVTGDLADVAPTNDNAPIEGELH